MICPNCQTENRLGAKFCDECGTRLDAVVQVSEPAEEEVVDSPAEDQVEEAEASVEPVEPESDQEPQEEQEAPASADPDATAVLTGLDVSVPIVFDVTPINLKSEDSIDSAARTLQIPVVTEKIASEAYVKPESAWKAGGTLEMPKVEGVDVPANTDFIAPDPNAKKLRRKQAKELRKQQKAAEREALRASGEGGKGRKIGIGIVLCIILAAAIAFGTYSLEIWGGKTVPSCQGKTAADASYILQNAGFSVRIDEVPSDDTEGLVLLTDPSEGARVPEGSQVIVHVAVSRVVPDVVNMSEADALAALSKAGYTNVGEVVYEKSDELDDVAISIDPAPGTKAKSATKITLTVAQAYTVPDVADMEEYEAIEAIKEAGFRARVNYVQNSSVHEGYAFGTEPEAGTKLESDSFVTIQVAVSRGTQLREKTAGYLQSQGSIVMNGNTYKVVSVDSTKYDGSGTVSFTATAQQGLSTPWGAMVWSPAMQISGKATFNDSDQLISIG